MKVLYLNGKFETLDEKEFINKLKEMLSDTKTRFVGKVEVFDIEKYKEKNVTSNKE